VERANASGTRPDERPDTWISIPSAKSAGRLVRRCTIFSY